MTIHPEPHPLAGQTVVVADLGPFRIEDYWDRVSGGSWMFAAGNPAALQYAIRSATAELPLDDDVVYGKSENGLGHIVHVSELAR